MAFTAPAGGGSGPIHVRATGSGAMAETLAPGAPFRLIAVKLHLSAAATQDTFTATEDNDAGAVYDVVLASQAMSGLADFVSTYSPAIPITGELDFAFANNDSRTWGLGVVYELVG